MKLLKFIFFSSFLLLIISCDDDNVDTTPFILSNENIVGTYNINELNIETKSNLCNRCIWSFNTIYSGYLNK